MTRLLDHPVATACIAAMVLAACGPGPSVELVRTCRNGAEIRQHDGRLFYVRGMGSIRLHKNAKLEEICR